MKDNNLYRKLPNGRYKAIGVCENLDRLTDGIYVVHHYANGRSVTSIPYLEGIHKVGEAKKLDIPTLSGIEQIADYVLHSQEICELIKKSFSVADVVRVAIRKTLEYGEHHSDK